MSRSLRAAPPCSGSMILYQISKPNQTVTVGRGEFWVYQIGKKLSIWVLFVFPVGVSGLLRQTKHQKKIYTYNLKKIFCTTHACPVSFCLFFLHRSHSTCCRVRHPDPWLLHWTVGPRYKKTGKSVFFHRRYCPAVNLSPKSLTGRVIHLIHACWTGQ